MNLADLKNLDPNDPGSWPAVIKGVVIALCCAAGLFAGYWFDTSVQLDALTKLEKEEVQLKQTFEFKQKKAANLEPYKKQLAEMERTFGALLRQLPNKAEIADLLVDVSQTGLASGLEFELFKPNAEVNKEFYAEYPIQIKVFGNFHQFGEFASGIAALPRIVTLHNISIESRSGKSKGDAPRLSMTALAKTYRYLEEEPQK